MTTLSAEQIVDILHALEELCVACQGENAGERRQSERAALRVPIDIIAWTDGAIGTNATVMLDDFSAGGIGFRHISAMAAGSHLLVRLPMKGSKLGYVPCVVRRCVGLDDGSYRIGAQFGDVLGPEDQPDTATAERGAEILRDALLR
jgi:hypothetical protein